MPRKPRVGRPKLPKGRAKAGTLRVRVRPEELKAIETKARRSKLTVSEWIRGTLAAAIQD